MPFSCNDLWSFASACYAQPGVEAACLELQAAGADVCLMLTGAWLECRGVRISELHLDEVRHLSERWQNQVVVPLRELRQVWKQPAAGDAALAQLRNQVKQLELSAERTQLERLQLASMNWPGGTATAHWLEQLHPELTLPAAALGTLRRAAAQLSAED